MLLVTAGLTAGPAMADPAPAPSVAVTSAPPSTTSETVASFSWITFGKVNRVSCALDGEALAPCSSPKTYSGLTAGPHTFVVRVSKGNTDATDRFSWTVTAPDGPPPAPPPADEEDPYSKYWGGWIEENGAEAPWDMSAATTFEQHAGKGVSLINWSSPFATIWGSYYRFQTPQFQAIRDHGAIPFFSWANNPGGLLFTDLAIAVGSQDAYIREWATAAKAWGHPFFLRFAWEMNGSWFPWGVGNGGTTAADHVAMWRHVHDIFRSVGATNATWVWCPNIDPYDSMADIASLYPGDAYVDWTCLDGYNGANPWASFESLFGPSYDEITQLAPTKPMIVGEVGSTEAGGSKAQWISDMFAALPARFPKIRGLLWFNKTETGPGGWSDWPIESSSSAQSAFAGGIASDAFVGSTLGSIAVSPISAPGG